jgi:PEP-CTERM motif
MRCSILLATAVGLLLSMAAHGATKPAPKKPADTIAQCSWDRPGHNPFVGDVVAAVDRYSDIPQPVRARLKERMQARQYDDMVDIRRDSIVGKHAYDNDIREMHFGKGRVCTQVTRKRWTASTHERGLVYCESGHCILVPTVCRNVSRINRRAVDVAGGPLFMGPVDPGDGAVSKLGSGDTAAGPAPIASSTSEAVAGVVVPFGAGAAGDPGAAGSFGDGAYPGGAGGFGADYVGPIALIVGSFVLSPNPIAAVPEPTTWAGMGAGLLLLLALRAWRQRRTGVPRCATQKRS